jgi:hypothetical protein
MQIAVQTDGAAGKRGDAKTQHDFRPVVQCDTPGARRYFGCRPIM